MKTCSKLSCYKKGEYKIGLGNNTYLYACDVHVSAFIPEDREVTVIHEPVYREIWSGNAESQEDF